MAEVVEEMIVDRAPSDVWAVLADFAAISRWASNVDHSSLTTEQAEGVGAQRRIQVGRNTVLERIVDWEPDHRLGYSITGLPPVVKSVINTWQLDDLGPSTRVRLTTQVQTGPRPPQQVVARVISRVLAKASRQMLDGLNEELKRDAS